MWAFSETTYVDSVLIRLYKGERKCLKEAMTMFLHDCMYRQLSNLRCTKCQTLNVSSLVLQLPLFNPLQQGIKTRMKM